MLMFGFVLILMGVFIVGKYSGQSLGVAAPFYFFLLLFAKITGSIMKKKH